MQGGYRDIFGGGFFLSHEEGCGAGTGVALAGSTASGVKAGVALEVLVLKLCVIEHFKDNTSDC
eukprot:7729550-Ditylum_brightwellii.AAC.1